MPKHRKFEYFEDQLKASASGREVLRVLKLHVEEVMYLVNNNRPAMVCWQRNHGPVFIKSFMDSGFEEDTEFVKEVKGIKTETLILQMAEVLQDFGSPELKMTVGKYTPVGLKLSRETSSLRNIINYINRIEKVY